MTLPASGPADRDFPDIPDFLRRHAPSTEEADMGRPKGSKNKPKTEAEAPAADGDETEAKAASNGAGVGHNSKAELTDEQRQVLFFQHLKKVRALKEKLASISGELRAAYKRAKSEIGSDARAMIDDALLLETDDGQEKMEAAIQRQAMVARWMATPLGAQAELFDDGREPAVDRARAAGKAARFNGEPCKPPHSPGVPQHDSWIEGWHEGEKALVEAQKRDDALAFGDPPAGAAETIGDQPSTYQ